MLPLLVIGAVTAGVVGKKILSGLFGSSSSNELDQLKPAPPVFTQSKPARRSVAAQPKPPRQHAFNPPKPAAFVPPKPPPIPTIRINPVTGLRMVGGVDVQGNPYGVRLRR
jgi:hypothetical protein